MVKNWAESVPEDFRFTLKVPKAITDSFKTETRRKEVTTFLNVIAPVGAKKGCLLAQFPPSFTIEPTDPFKKLLQNFSEAPQISEWTLAVEFRHPSWQEPEVYHRFKDFNASMVLHDMNNSDATWSQIE